MWFVPAILNQLVQDLGSTKIRAFLPKSLKVAESSITLGEDRIFRESAAPRKKIIDPPLRRGVKSCSTSLSCTLGNVLK